MTDICSLYDKYKKGGRKASSYWVNDLCAEPEKVLVVFILESPHFSEVCHGHPLAGSSGLAVTKQLKSITDVNGQKFFKGLDCDIPFGCYLNISNDKRVAVLNVSNMPMNPSVYACSITTKTDLKLQAALKCFKDRPKAELWRNNNEQKKLLKDMLVENLGHRLEHLTHFITEWKNVRVFPCGEVAFAFMEKAMSGSEHLKKISFEKLPHPSRNGWSCDFNSYCDLINKAMASPGKTP